MATSTVVTRAPARDALAWIIGDAISWREPAREGCCEGKEACRDHEGDGAVALAMTALLAEVREAASDGEAIAALLAFSPHVLAEIARYAEADDDADGGARDDG